MLCATGRRPCVHPGAPACAGRCKAALGSSSGSSGARGAVRRPRRRPVVCYAAPDDAANLPPRLAELERCPGLSARYALGPEVGRGSFALVLEATDLRTGERLCAKKLPKFKHNQLPHQAAAAVAAEADTQRALAAACPSVLRFREVVQDSSYFYIISELCASGDLSKYLAGRGRVSEREAAHILRGLLTALAACHRLGVVYRDVKPQNLLIRSIDANGLPEVVLADFGCCRSTAGPQPSNRVSAGTPLYSAPECVHGLGGSESDMWSAGVLLFHLLSGSFPFCDPRHAISQGEYWRRVAEAPIHYAGPAWHHVSPGAVALLQRMLTRDCSRRISAEEALSDPWLADMTSSRRLPAHRVSGAASNVLPGLPHYHHDHPSAVAAAAGPKLAPAMVPAATR